MKNQLNSDVPREWRSLLLLVLSVGLIAFGFGLQLLIDTTPPGGSGEFQGINHFGLSLMLVLLCIPGTILVSSIGFGMGLMDLKNTVPGNKYVTGATAIHAIICIAWLVRFLKPMADIFLNIIRAL